jgi:hypothetical protein
MHARKVQASSSMSALASVRLVPGSQWRGGSHQLLRPTVVDVEFRV